MKGLDPWNGSLEDFQSADPGMARCLELARIAARTDLPILILGESGTGKTLLARAIHNSSARAKAPFVSFNAAALSDTLLDSQLFGHERGAFTGAQKRVKGKFELAGGGTLFIDEIADMSPLAQAKILRAVEYGEFERLGSEKIEVADVRLISATHFPLRKFLDSDQLRKDLFYRINGLTLTIAPLRERPHDLRSLVAAQIVRAGGQQGKTITGLSTFGRMCRQTMRGPDAPRPRAATTYSRCITESTSARTRRDTSNHPVSPMTRMSALSGTGLHSASTATRSNTRGIARNASSSRIMTASTRPPR